MTELVLHEAAVNGEYQQLESMLMIHRIDLDHKDEDFGDRTALHWAASRGWRICHFSVNYVNFYTIVSASFPVSIKFTHLNTTALDPGVSHFRDFRDIRATRHS